MRIQGQTMNGFIFVGTKFRGLNKNDTSVGFKIRGHGSVKIHAENYHFVGTGIRGSDPQRKPQKFQ